MGLRYGRFLSQVGEMGVKLGRSEMFGDFLYSLRYVASPHMSLNLAPEART